ncbi:hypothetical protein J8N07_19350 [Chryseobacterium arthrosphaerae]|uniref:hypothetical protein n=1 Tax=Chryseobacterium arthrosphaerae TaxID=651561 RepID=UPI001E4ED2A6|nr:hypothetical protein [Chryseobacterium arthrosphaerae]UEQ75780.1 hypothetical protein J8N07_19350 [Chryseobacterium arthrosphaerae]
MKTLVLSLFILSFISCESGKKDQRLNSATGFSKVADSESIYCGAFCDPPSITYKLAGDSTCAHSSQDVLNCFAWKNFIALNWAASAQRGVPDTTATAANYGMPGDYSPTVWESFASNDEVFAPKNLLTWNLKSKNGYVKQINEINKFTDINISIPKATLRAAVGNSNVDEILQAEGSWLTDQSGNIVWYEIKINNIESDFIRRNKLYDYNSLKEYGTANNGVWLPMESIELKAAWRIIPEDKLDSLKNYYKISKAMVPEIKGFKDKKPVFGKSTQKYLGLVGLHIIRKTPQSPQFNWMTFEHIHNAPNEGQADPSVRYCFYNPKSTKTPNIAPVIGQDSLNTPVQVVRVNKIKTKLQKLNTQMQQLIRASNPKSVWQYYQLVNIQWPENPIQDNGNNKSAPLMEGGITPSDISNTTMETYAQQKQCMDCHKYASVVGSGMPPTDYSFIFLKVKPEKQIPKGKTPVK